jgi:potassium/chloride transporter 9
VPAWKKAFKLRVAVFVEYESDVEEERGRVKSLLEKLRIEAEVLVFWLASGNLPTYEIIVNGGTPGQKEQDHVDDELKDQEWWDELQKIRGRRDGTPAVEDLSEIATIFTSSTLWPESSFQQGPREERVERFLGLRKLLRRSKRKHTASRLSRLGVSLGMRTQSLSPHIMKQSSSYLSASEDDSSSSSESDNEANDDGTLSEADVDEYESEPEQKPIKTPIKRRRSHGDSMRGPPVSKKSTGEKEITVPSDSERVPLLTKPQSSFGTTSGPSIGSGPVKTRVQDKRPKVSALTSSLKSEPSNSRPPSPQDTFDTMKSPTTPGASISGPSSTRPASSKANERPSLSRHASMPKFTSKPVPITRVATEDGPGPSIMFTDTPSPPPRRQRLPSAYDSSYPFTNPSIPTPSPAHSRRGSTYSTQGLPLSFNDLPCRAQHLILNELMKKKSRDTAVVFTTLPSPVEGTGGDEMASRSYLGDLEVLCRGLPPVMLVHSNSMTVTMSL